MNIEYQEGSVELRRILVTTKRVPDTDQRIRVRDDRQGIDEEHLPHVINPFDAIALEEALRIRERLSEVEIVAAGIGSPEYERELRTALAMESAIFSVAHALFAAGSPSTPLKLEGCGHQFSATES